MKKTLILAIVGLFAFVHSASAQFYVGGSFHINSRLAEEKSLYVGFSPDLGYTVGDWCFGSVLNLAVQDGSAAFTATRRAFRLPFQTTGPCWGISAGWGMIR